MWRSWHKSSVCLWAAALVAAAIACVSSAAADAPIEIGRTIFVVNDVEGKMGDAEAKRVVLNENVLYEEDIITADQAETIMEFRDGSTFEVGPGAVVRIDSFVFNPEESVSRKTVSIGRGVFRYISGIAANEQDTRISTANGVLAIRGSVVAGIVDPEVPTFVYVGEGAAVFTNDAGSTDMQPGSAIAVPSRTTPLKPASAMPPAIAAQALQAIERRLPPRDVLRNRPPASDAWLRRAGAANLLPIAEQAQRLGTAAGRPLTSVSGPSPIAGELGLLVEGHRRNLFDGAQATRTPEQENFITQTARVVPNAPALIAQSTARAGALHQSARLAGTAVVIRGVAAAAPSPEVVSRVASAAVRADPAAAPIITQNAVERFQGPARDRIGAQLSKAAAEARGSQQPAAIPASAPSSRVAARPAAERAQPSRSAATEGTSGSRPGKPPAAIRPPPRRQAAARTPPPRRQAAARPPLKQAPRKQPVRDRRDEAR